MKITGTVTYVGTLEQMRTMQILTVIVTAYECRYQVNRGVYYEQVSYGIKLFNEMAAGCKLRCGDMVGCEFNVITRLLRKGDGPPKVFVDLCMANYVVLPDLVPRLTSHAFVQPRQESLDQD